MLYEYPFNERVRTLLRLEDLWDKFSFFLAQENALQHHTALVTLFEMLDIVGRADLKSDLLQELERQRQVLAAFRNNPQIEERVLEEILTNIEQAAQGLSQSQGKTGQYLRDNEWLMSVRSRTIIPGGACEFDLPSYHAWLQQSHDIRRQDIERWVGPMQPLFDSIQIVLRLLRESGHRSHQIAQQGSFQQMLGGKQYQMMQVRIADPRFIPEMSANKYMLWVRFTTQDGDLKPKPAEQDVPFDLTLCNF
ncbi:cell division protein ZapD [Parvibium lacunae]|uniref:Cell division protein ZapD n=1 Tax=Parvibium lacunae TaxID=1888893 RepID=A0A368L249_9BURK|nr:cell division protein ZapD [Parvibium lacunae]RCS57617.1 cell division protein ZapD [Parvibium lacunae]